MFPRNALLNFLRKFPFVYACLRFIHRITTNAVVSLARAIAPASSLLGPPKGFFSDLELVRQSKVKGKIILPFQNCPALPSGSLRKLSGLRQDEFQPWPIFWSHHHEARLVGRTLVLLNAQKQASLEAMYHLHCYKNDPAFCYLRLPAPVRLNGNWTSVVSQWSTRNYCHWLTDVLPRLALLDEFPSDTKVIVPPNLSAYERDSLKWLGLEHRLRPTSERHLAVEDFYFSSPTAMTGCYDPYAVAFLREKILKFADVSYESPRRFYVQRLGRTRGILNEAEIISEMRLRGFEIVDCAKLTMAQQIQLFSKAEAICALHGAALANLVWCQPGCKVFELVAHNYQNGVFEGIAGIVGVDHRFLINQADSSFRVSVPMAEFKKFLDS